MHANKPRIAPSSPARRVSYADAAPEESSLLAPSFGPQRKTHGLPPQEREKSVAHDVVARSRQVDLEAHLPGLSMSPCHRGKPTAALAAQAVKVEALVAQAVAAATSRSRNSRWST